ncbi:MAG: hypothetical protein KA271_00545 [Propionivibrio sp.]|nr:hypothetical protein [Propionivibrio sp.]
MLPQLPEMTTPNWLSELSSESILASPFPLQELLRDSLYYPSSAFDGDPVRHLAGNFLSFIYVDYGVSQDRYAHALTHSGFRGYDLIATRLVTESELVPAGWQPRLPLPADGNPSHHYRNWIARPFCSWSIFQRSDKVPPGHGPLRFSLLFLCADGAAAFQALYIANNSTPKAVAIIQPGHRMFGGNWTNYTNPEQIFARSVLGNPNGVPDILLYGGYGERDLYRSPCWPAYCKAVCFVDKVLHESVNRVWRGWIGIWTRDLLT